jgi:hypothetical protein
VHTHTPICTCTGTCTSAVTHAADATNIHTSSSSSGSGRIDFRGWTTLSPLSETIFSIPLMKYSKTSSYLMTLCTVPASLTRPTISERHTRITRNTSSSPALSAGSVGTSCVMERKENAPGNAIEYVSDHADRCMHQTSTHGGLDPPHMYEHIP